jgi:hypothetical protein
MRVLGVSERRGEYASAVMDSSAINAPGLPGLRWLPRTELGFTALPGIHYAGQEALRSFLWSTCSGFIKLAYGGRSILAQQTNAAPSSTAMAHLLASLVIAASTVTGASAAALSCKSYPGTAFWPSNIAWAALNFTVGGRLEGVVPPAAVCHNSFNGAKTYNAAECSSLSSNWGLQSTQYATPHVCVIGLLLTHVRAAMRTRSPS